MDLTGIPQKRGVLNLDPLCDFFIIFTFELLHCAVPSLAIHCHARKIYRIDGLNVNYDHSRVENK